MTKRKSAADLLRRWMDENGCRQIDLAATLAVTPSAISNVLGGRYKPSARLAFALEDLTGIPARGWIE